MKVLAYGVHLFTALGAALGIWSLILIFDGFHREALWVLAAAVLVDSVDGALARLFDTKTNAPGVDGALMDNIIDFVTWTVAPLCWIYAIMPIPEWVLMICAVSSIFGFSKKEAKTSDHFFTGFPSYWNIVVFYLFLLNLSVAFSSAILLAFSVAVFVPVKFIYPTRTPYLRPITIALGVLYFVQLTLMVILFDETPYVLMLSSFIFPVYYFGFSFYLNLKGSETSLPS